jgi:hypothetical protein
MPLFIVFFFFFIYTATTVTYTRAYNLSLLDALPIWQISSSGYQEAFGEESADVR